MNWASACWDQGPGGEALLPALAPGAHRTEPQQAQHGPEGLGFKL